MQIFQPATGLKQRIGLTLMLGLFLVVAIFWLDQHIRLIEQSISNLGHWASIGFIIIFSILAPLFFSVDILCLIAGAIFSLPVAIFNVLLATMIAALIIFLVSNRISIDRVDQLVCKFPKFEKIEQLINVGGFRILFLIRLLPVPFALTSYLFAFSRTKFLVYWLSTTGVFFYHATITYFGYLAAHVSRQFSQGKNYLGPDRASLVGGILLCIVVLLFIISIANKQLATASKDS